MIERICEQCGETFFVKPYVLQRGGGRFCSRRCHYNSEITRIERVCLTCGKHFSVVPSKQESKFCSRKCYEQAKRPKVGRICQWCGGKFYAWSCEVGRRSAKYCSRACYDQARRSVKKICQQCGKIFPVAPSKVKQRGGKFCSLTCYGLAQRRLVERTCQICEKRFFNKPSRVRLFCSKECFAIACRQHRHTAKAIQKIAVASQGRHPSKKTREKQTRIVKELWQKPEYIEAHRLASKKLWQDLKYVRKTLAGVAQKPTHPEERLDGILQSNLPEFQYNGDGRLGIVLAGLVPDFPNVNGKKQIIEVFGDYWHRLKKSKWHQTELGRIMAYNSVGWDCLIIWEHELKELTEEHIVGKIKVFQESKAKRR